MKSDRQIQSDVIDQLGFNPNVTTEKIGVTVFNGIVTLSGTVPSYAEKHEAEKTACRVSGVKSIVEEIEVDLLGSHKRSDLDLAAAVSHALKWDIYVPKEVKATVEHGEVTLRGTVEYGNQRESAVAAIRRLTGVKGIINLIQVAPQSEVKPSEIKDTIEKALMRSARDEANQIKVEVKKDKVILSGKVRTFEESQEARWAAWSVPGISKVENRLQVA